MDVQGREAQLNLDDLLRWIKGGGVVPDASQTVKGKLQLTGGLAGFGSSAANPVLAHHLPVFNAVTDFGCVRDGVTDDTTRLQDTIDACIADGGGIVYVPRGDYRKDGPLDFSAMSGTYKGLLFCGAGSGGRDGGYRSCTRFLNFYAGNGGLYAQSVSAGDYITGLYFADFAIKNEINIGNGNWTIYWNGLPATCGMKRINVYGSDDWGFGAGQGNGISVLNPFNGQMTFDEITVGNFSDYGSTFYRFATKTENGFAGVSSGNIETHNCIAINYGATQCGVAVRLGDPSAAFSGAVFSTFKTVGDFETNFWLTNCDQCGFDSPHIEAGLLGFYLEHSSHNNIRSPRITLDGGAGGQGFYFGGDATGRGSLNNNVENAWFINPAHDATGFYFDIRSMGNVCSGYQEPGSELLAFRGGPGYGNAVRQVPADTTGFAPLMKEESHFWAHAGFAMGQTWKPAQFTADKNDLSDGAFGVDYYNFISMTSNAARNLTGIVYPVPPRGQLIVLLNTGAFTITLKHNNAGSSLDNRFHCPGGVDYALAAGHRVLAIYGLNYDGVGSNRWVVIG